MICSSSTSRRHWDLEILHSSLLPPVRDILRLAFFFTNNFMYILHHRIPRLLHRKCFSHFNTSYKVSSNNCYLSFIRFTTRQTNQIFSKYTFYLVKSKISLEIEAHCLTVVNVHFLFCLYVRDSDVKVET